MSKDSTKRGGANKKPGRKRGTAEPADYIENGHEVVDLAAADRNDKRAASMILAVIEAEIVPRWLRDTIVGCLAEAARRIGSPLQAPVLKDGKVTVVPNENPHFQNPRQNLTTLISITPGNFTLRLSERARLAHAISTILNSEETPVPLYNAVGDFVTGICTPLVDDSPEVIEKALALEQEPLVKKRKVRAAV